MSERNRRCMCCVLKFCDIGHGVYWKCFTTSHSTQACRRWWALKSASIHGLSSTAKTEGPAPPGDIGSECAVCCGLATVIPENSSSVTFSIMSQQTSYCLCCVLYAGKSLVCTVWPHTATNMPSLPQRLGIVFCLNRPCALYTVKVPFTCKNNTPSDADPKAHCLTEQVLSVASAKFSPDGSKLVFLSHDAAASSGVHCATAKLMSIPWSAGTPSSCADC